MNRAGYRWGFSLALCLGLVLAGCGDDGDSDGTTDLPLNPDDYHHEACADLDRRVVNITTDMDTDDILTAFVDAQAGDIIQFEAGTWQMTRELTLDAPCVVVRGMGSAATILDWEGTTTGKGIFASGGANNFTAEDFRILNTFDNGIEVRGTENIILRRLHVEWTGEAESSNGRYAVYPVECRNLLMEHNTARRAADAGIYVGQCHNAVLRWNTAIENVSGIQVENTLGADVYENLAYSNTLGFLIHDLPGLPTSNGDQARIYRNAVFENNFQNFSRESDLTTNIPRGSGMIVLARADVEIFENEFRNNSSLNFAAVSYLLLNPENPDPNYDPYPYRIHLHGNSFSGGGNSPESSPERPLGQFLSLIRTYLPDDRIPSIMVDGILPDGAGEGNPHEICIDDAYDGHFVNLNIDLVALGSNDIGTLIGNLDTDDSAFRCQLDPLDSTEMLARVGPGQGQRPSVPSE